METTTACLISGGSVLGSLWIVWAMVITFICILFFIHTHDSRYKRKD